MSQPTSLPAQIVADTIIRTVELGVRIIDAAVAGETTVLWCELLVDGPGRCPGCGIAGTYRDTIERRVSDVPVVGHPLELRVRVPRYRCRPRRLRSRGLRPRHQPAGPARRVDHPALRERSSCAA